MTKLIMLRGLPGSGKSTWAREIVAIDPTKTVRVNKDTLRDMLHNGVFRGDKTERLIRQVRDVTIRTCLEAGKTVICDDTNLAPEHEETLRQLAHDVGVEFSVNDRFLDVSVRDCIANDLKRPDSVGSKVIQKMYLKYLAPKYEPPIYDPAKIDAALYDIDGTLAHFVSRSPYDYSRVSEDLVDEVVRGFAHNSVANGLEVLVVSGRKSICMDDTTKWLVDNNIPFSELYMRGANDERADYIVKGEIYDEHIAPFYNVRYVCDDRASVVDMWRSRGLKCLAVAEGDF